MNTLFYIKSIIPFLSLWGGTANQPTAGNPPRGQRKLPGCCPLPCAVCGVCGWEGDQGRCHSGEPHLSSTSSPLPPPQATHPLTNLLLTFEIICPGCPSVNRMICMIFICVFQCLSQFAFQHVEHMCWHICMWIWFQMTWKVYNGNWTFAHK